MRESNTPLQIAREAGQQAPACSHLAQDEEGPQALLDQAGSLPKGTHRQRVGDRLAEEPVLLVPAAGAQVRVRDQRGSRLQPPLAQDLHHIVMTATKRRDEAGPIVMAREREGRQLQAGDPAFGARLQLQALLCRKRQPHHLHQVVGI